MYSHLGYAFGGGEGRNNFFGHIGDKLYAKVNFWNLPCETKIRAVFW